MVRVLPVLFNTDMVQAILDGRKGATRRVVKYKYSNTEMKMRTDKYGTRLIEIQKDIEGETHGKNPDGSTWRKLLPYIERNPPCRKGDILYVRETWCTGYNGEAHFYRADKNTERASKLIDYDKCRWRPSIHMPKAAARIWLKVTGVRVERLQDMALGDFLREGVAIRPEAYNDPDNAYGQARDNFIAIWDSTVSRQDKGRYGWEANPWVWVIGFERCGKPELRLEA